ncbi:MAG: hypothetical protein Q4E36_06500 [Bacillota bacterium]|nr:hypothetical protein [Bacillota bacterium]
MKKLRMTLLICLLLLLGLNPSKAYADVGPKPSVTIDIKNLRPGHPVYVTLLAKEESTGPYSLGHELPDHKIDLKEGFEKFKSLEDKDGYNFLGYLEKLDGPGSFSWSYRPPEDFKIAIYNPELNSVLISQPMSRYAFNSNYEMTYSPMGLEDQVFYFDYELQVTKVIDYLGQVRAFALRLLLTILIEYGLAILIFRPTAYQSKLIIKTNIFTQVLLNLGISLLLYFYGFLAFFLVFIPMEILVFVVEAGIYKKKLNQDLPGEKKAAPAVLYALVANLASAGAGYFLVRNFEFLNKLL